MSELSRNRRYLLTSESPIKREVLESIVANVTCVGVQHHTVAGRYNAPQPVGKSGLVCAKLRITSIPVEERQKYDYVVAIENSIERATNRSGEVVFQDVVNVVVLAVAQNFYYAQTGCPVPFPASYWPEAEMYPYPSGSGFTVTIGELMVADPACKASDPKNWMKDFHPFGRREQIRRVLNTCFARVDHGPGMDYLEMSDCAANIRYVPDHPKPGVLFQDMGPLLGHPALLETLVLHAVLPRQHAHPDYIVGLDARGFILGSMLALKWRCGFVMARKPGKLPNPKASVDYGLEYGHNTLEMALDAFGPVKTEEGPRKTVLIVDDLIATGGSVIAAAELIRMTANPPAIVGCLTILSVPELLEGTRKKIKEAGVPRLITLI